MDHRSDGVNLSRNEKELLRLLKALPGQSIDDESLSDKPATESLPSSVSQRTWCNVGWPSYESYCLGSKSHSGVRVDPQLLAGCRRSEIR